jgi:hypothetical protein
MLWFKSQRYIQQRKGVNEADKHGRGREWVIARSLCHYRCFDLSDIPATKRDSHLSWQIRQWSPFRNYGEYIVWQQGKAQAWIWDQTAQRTAQARFKVQTYNTLAETLLHIPARNGLQLQQCCEGIEARIWQQGCLSASRWWPTTPSAQSWRQFLRAHRLALDTPMPDAQALAWQSKPWGKARRALSGLQQLRREGLWLTLGLTLFCVLLSWQMVAAWRQLQALEAVKQNVAVLMDQAGPILQARNQAMSDQARIHTLLSLNAYPPQLKLFVEILDLLPDTAAKLREWRYHNGELRFTVEAPKLDPKNYVQILQTHPLLDNIKTENTRNSQQLVLHINLVKKQ